jgi:proline racemase
VLLDRVPVKVDELEVEVAVAFGGAFYGIVSADRFELPVEPAFLSRFIELGRRLKAGIEAQEQVFHPLKPELEGIYGIIFTQGNRNLTVFADGEVDRSPCGSGTSARLALLYRRGELGLNDAFMHESVIGTRFEGRLVEETRVGHIPAVITEVEGSAHRTGYHQFVLDSDDPIGTGFLLR